MKKEGDLEIELTYHVASAFWTPAYDVHLSPGIARLTRRAVVTNRTYEDWEDVKLVVSTASSEPVTVSEPDPWTVSEEHILAGPAGLPAEAAPVVGGRIGAAKVEETRVGRFGDTVLYEIQSRVTLPHGRMEHPLELTSDELESETRYYWYADEMAEVVAYDRVTNRGAVILPGPAKVFRDDKYIGTTEIPLVAPEEEFKIGVRTAYDVRAEKKLKKREAEKAGMTRGKKKRTYEYELVVENFSNDSIEIEIFDRIPHSQDPEIEVALAKVGHDLVDFRLGILKWVREIGPGEEIRIAYSYVVVWDKDITVTPPLP